MLAPAALLVIALAVALIVVGSTGSDGDSNGDTETAVKRPGSSAAAGGDRRARARATYTVRPGDTLGRIAERTGVDVEALQELNPSLDPQALVAGQKIKLRE